MTIIAAMMARNRILPVLTLAAVMVGFSASRAAAKEIPARHSGFFQSADPDAAKGVAISVYKGKYDPDADYDKLTPTTTKTVICDGMGTDPFPKVDGEATYVARGLIEVKTTGVYAFSPGYGDSTCNITELEGREVYRKEPGKEPVRIRTKMIGGKRYAFKTTFLARAANGLFWVGRRFLQNACGMGDNPKRQLVVPLMSGASHLPPGLGRFSRLCRRLAGTASRAVAEGLSIRTT